MPLHSVSGQQSRHVARVASSAYHLLLPPLLRARALPIMEPSFEATTPVSCLFMRVFSSLLGRSLSWTSRVTAEARLTRRCRGVTHLLVS